MILKKKYIVVIGISGASGIDYTFLLIKYLLKEKNINIYITLSDAAISVLKIEKKLNFLNNFDDIKIYFKRYFNEFNRIYLFHNRDWNAPIASGSYQFDNMIICPCSSGTLSSIAYGSSNNLIERAADVTIKEKKNLILVTRETPISSIYIENMLKLSKIGVRILPASPGFYYNPKTINDLIIFIVDRIIKNLVNIPFKNTILKSWGE